MFKIYIKSNRNLASGTKFIKRILRAKLAPIYKLESAAVHCAHFDAFNGAKSKKNYEADTAVFLLAEKRRIKVFEKIIGGEKERTFQHFIFTTTIIFTFISTT